MTDEAKALVAELRALSAWLITNDLDLKLPDEIGDPDEIADLIETQAREIERLRGAISAALRCTPQAKHGTIIYDCGDPWEILTAALAGDSHDQ